LVQKAHVVAASKDLIAYEMDWCEQICNGNVDCIKDCHSKGLRRVAEFIERINPGATSPDRLNQMVSEYKRSARR